LEAAVLRSLFSLNVTEPRAVLYFSLIEMRTHIAWKAWRILAPAKNFDAGDLSL
jgi:hypothetical protein